MRPEPSNRPETEVPVGVQQTLEQAEPALTEVVESAVAVQARIAEAKGDTTTYALPVKDSTGSKIAAFDIETCGLDITDPDNRILSIALVGSDGTRECWAWDSEDETIASFLEKARDYDGLLGWNTDNFDLPMLEARMKVHGFQVTDFTIPPVLDCLRAHKQLLRKSETKLQLDYVAKKYLKVGKMDFDPSKTKEFFETRGLREKLMAYNLHDADLVLRLDAVMGYWATLTSIYEESRCADPKWQYDLRTFALRSEKKQENGFVWWRPIMGLIQKHCEKLGVPNPFDWPSDSEKENRKELLRANEARPGGFVMNPAKGHHTNVIEFDFKSLYPSLIMSFNIDPRTWMPPGNGEIVAPHGTYSHRIRGVIPSVLTELVRERTAVKAELAAAKARGASKEETAALKGRTEALKILNNSFYGLYYAGFSPIFHFDSARNITTLGQECVRLMLDTVKQHGARAIAGDTDSTYIEVSDADFNEAFAERLSKTLTESVAAHLKAKYNVTFVGSFDLKGLYDHMAIYKAKRYAKLLHGKPVEEMEVIGYERGDVFEVQLDLQEEMFRRMFDPSRGTIPGAISDARERLRTDHTLVLRWKRGKTSAEGRALRRLMEVGLPPAPGDSVGFLITGKNTKKFPERRIAARRLDGETIEWVTETDPTPHREKVFLEIPEEEDLVWQSILESLDGVQP
jgi:DNA polymerase elongation subunit (family B)